MQSYNVFSFYSNHVALFYWITSIGQTKCHLYIFVRPFVCLLDEHGHRFESIDSNPSQGSGSTGAGHGGSRREEGETDGRTKRRRDGGSVGRMDGGRGGCADGQTDR